MEERQCWICFQSESETKGATWVSPCNCRGDLAYAHEQCLLLWIDEKQKGHAFRPVKCPQCLRDYVITYPAPAPLLRLAEVGNGVINIAFPYLAVSGVLYCGYISCATYGFYAILQLLGPEESEALLWDSPHLDWRMYLGLPLIPVSLVWARMDSFDSLLPFLPILILPSTSLRLTWPPSPSLILSLLPWARIFYKVARASLHSFLFGPSPSSSTASSMSNLNLNLNLNLNNPLNPNLNNPNNNNPNNNNPNNNPNNNNNNNNNNNGPQVRHHRVDMTNPIRTIVGALLLPVLSSTTGSLFFGGLIRNTFHRNVLGGCLFIVVKDMISFLYTYFWRKRQSQRRIQSFPRDPTH